jgi:hypothetical protein
MYEELRSWAEMMAVHGHMQARIVLMLLDDYERLKRGDFTAEEFQAIKHKLEINKD